ncbi:MAG: Hsp20/alpha crystallin family protein [Zavarzinella sp.]
MRNVVRWTENPLRWVDALHQQMDDVFNRVYQDGSEVAKASTWAPRLDLVETEGAYEVKVDLPGIAPENVEVNLNDNVLTIQGERKVETENKEKNYHRIERVSGTFYRAITLPAKVDDEAVQASFEHGVLHVVVPKKPESRGKRITVQAKQN